MVNNKVISLVIAKLQAQHPDIFIVMFGDFNQISRPQFV